MIRRLILPILLSVFAAFSLLASDNKYNLNADGSQFKIQYMGNVEAGHVFLWENFKSTAPGFVTHKGSSGIVTLSTTHGVKLKPYLFTGLGVGAWFGYYSGGATLRLPIYANVRASIPNRRFRLFIDLKAGHNFVDYNLSFIGPSIGCKFAWGNKGGVYLSAGTNYIINHNYSNSWDGLNLKIGFDF